MTVEPYNMSFTSGGLLHRESVLLAEVYERLGNWATVREHALQQNLLQARTQSSLKRKCREVVFRLQNLSADELRYFANCSSQDQAYLLWVAACRRYRFIGDFAAEILREHYVSLKPDLPQEEFDIFFNRKSEWHTELERVAPSTRGKLRQVLFRMLLEADLISPQNIINPAMPSPRLLNTIRQHRPDDLLFFPIFDSDLKRMTQ